MLYETAEFRMLVDRMFRPNPNNMRYDNFIFSFEPGDIQGRARKITDRKITEWGNSLLWSMTYDRLSMSLWPANASIKGLRFLQAAVNYLKEKNLLDCEITFEWHPIVANKATITQGSTAYTYMFINTALDVLKFKRDKLKEPFVFDICTAKCINFVNTSVVKPINLLDII